MEGSVRYAKNRVRITTQLIDAETDEHLWSETYERDFDDICAQADIAMNIANAIEAEFSIEEQQSIEKSPTDSQEAYAAYLQGLAAMSINDWDSLEARMNEAISFDPEFADAHAQLGFLYSLSLTEGDPSDRQERERIARESSERALALDPTQGVAHAALAAVHQANWSGTEAEESFRLATELLPNADVFMAYARFKRYRGEYEEAIRLNQRAVELDPRTPLRHSQLAVTYRFAGDFEAAVTAGRYALALTPLNVGTRVNLSQSEIGRGNIAEGLEMLAELERTDLDTNRLSQVALSYALANRSEDAQRIFARFEEAALQDPAGDAVWARAYLAIASYEQALQRLQSAVSLAIPTNVAALTELAANPWGNPELETPDFREILDGLWDRE